MSFWMMLYHLLCVLEDVFFFGYLFDHGYDLEREHFFFFADIRLVSVPGSDVNG